MGVPPSPGEKSTQFTAITETVARAFSISLTVLLTVCFRLAFWVLLVDHTRGILRWMTLNLKMDAAQAAEQRREHENFIFRFKVRSDLSKQVKRLTGKAFPPLNALMKFVIRYLYWF